MSETQLEPLTPRPEGAFVRNDGVRIYYEVHGSGPPLLLHHGWSSNAERWHAAGYVAVLKEEFRVVLLDARGHGRSDKPHDDALYKLELRTADVAAVLDAAGVESAHYWGYSMGARTGFAMLQMHRDRLRSLINGAAAPGRPRLHEQESLRRRAEQTLAGDPALPATQKPDFFQNDLKALAAASLGLLYWDGVDVRTLDVPSLHYAGDQDGLRPACEQTASRMPDAIFKLIAGVDHRSGFDRSDLVLPLALEFLRGLEGGSTGGRRRSGT
jgi:pimeloyl-ACP methyl ester carboxylesterase